MADLLTTTYVLQVEDPIWREWLAEVTYKPGWTFALGGMGMGGFDPRPLLTIGAHVLDSTTREPAWIIHTMPLDAQTGATREEFLRAVLSAVKQIETHEAMEFLRASGERVVDPHLPGQVLYG